jgi:predicted cupin superfamily sugar epimerase
MRTQERHPDVARIVEALELRPHPEGGFFRETFRSSQRIAASPDGAPREVSTAIYFLLPAGEFSAFHRICRSDELWHFHDGDPVEIHMLDSSGGYRAAILGLGIGRGERPQILVPAGTYQAAITRGSRFALCGCTVSPGFEFADFEIPVRDSLVARFPLHEQVIRRLTKG